MKRQVLVLLLSVLAALVLATACGVKSHSYSGVDAMRDVLVSAGLGCTEYASWPWGEAQCKVDGSNVMMVVSSLPAQDLADDGRWSSRDFCQPPGIDWVKGSNWYLVPMQPQARDGINRAAKALGGQVEAETCRAPSTAKVTGSPTAGAPASASAGTSTEEQGAPTLAFIDASHGWVGEMGGTILATSDGGVHWSQLSSIAELVYGLDFISPTDGWAATREGLFETHDGGSKWTLVPTGVAGEHVNRVRFIDSLHGWIDSGQRGLLRAADGSTWIPASTPCSPRASPRAGFFTFLDERRGWTLCPTRGAALERLFKTDDGGTNWQLVTEVAPQPVVPFDGHMNATDLFMLDENHGWISGFRGLAETTDGGRTWTRFESVSDEELYPQSIVFFSPTLGYMVTHPTPQPSSISSAEVSALYKSEDGGLSWTQVRCGFPQPCAWSTPTQ
jgi:photosystem II stability/assembly factor-like uncharacterized protein